VQSPPGTAIILAPAHVPDRRLSRAILYRVLRQISPFPWGSIASQCHRNHATIDRLAAVLWGATPVPLQSFTSAALVLWTPIVFRSNGSYRRATPAALVAAAANGFRIGWLACRAPPDASTAASLTKDITDQVAEALQNEKESTNVLFDCRFSVEVFSSARTKQLLAGNRLIISPEGRLTLPRLHWRSDIDHLANSSDTLPQEVDGLPVWQYTFIRPL